MEAFISKKATPYVEILAPEAVRLIWANLPIAYEDGSNILARANMAWSSTLAGMMLAQSGVIAVHAVSQALGAHLHVPHGVGVALATPIFLEYNRNEAIERYVKLAEELGIGRDLKNKDDIADEFIKQVKGFLGKFNMPDNLKNRANEIDRAKLIENAMINAPLSMVNNPRLVTKDDMEKIIAKII
jgi:alcohol dehydrogenase class IV